MSASINSIIEERSDQILVIAGPTGSGKGTVTKVVETEYGFQQIPFITNRSLRPGEAEYGCRQITMDAFHALVSVKKIFIPVYNCGNAYGCHIEQVSQPLLQGKNIVLESPPGMITTDILPLMPYSLRIGLMPTLNFISQALAARGTEKPEEQLSRLEVARNELEELRLLSQQGGLVTIIEPRWGDTEFTVTQVRKVVDTFLRK